MSHRTMKAMGAVGIALTLALSAAGCSGEDKASKEDYESYFQEEFGELGDDKVVGEVVDCIVDETYDDMSADAVNAIAEGDEEYEASAEDEKILEDGINKCVTDVMGE